MPHIFEGQALFCYRDASIGIQCSSVCLFALCPTTTTFYLCIDAMGLHNKLNPKNKSQRLGRFRCLLLLFPGSIPTNGPGNGRGCTEETRLLTQCTEVNIIKPLQLEKSPAANGIYLLGLVWPGLLVSLIIRLIFHVLYCKSVNQKSYGKLN